MPSQEEYLDNLLKDLTGTANKADEQMLEEVKNISDEQMSKEIQELLDNGTQAGYSDSAEDQEPEVFPVPSGGHTAPSSEHAALSGEHTDVADGEMPEDFSDLSDEQMSKAIRELLDNENPERFPEPSGKQISEEIQNPSGNRESGEDSFLSEGQISAEEEEMQAEELSQKKDSSVSVTDTIDLSEDDIENFLSQIPEEEDTVLSSESGKKESEDLMEMLNETEDSDLQDIYDLLKKAESDEPLSDGQGFAAQEKSDRDSSVTALGKMGTATGESTSFMEKESGIPDNINSEDSTTAEATEEDPLTTELDVSDQADMKKQKAKQRQQKREEKKAVRTARKEAKAAAKQMKREESLPAADRAEEIPGQEVSGLAMSAGNVQTEDTQDKDTQINDILNTQNKEAQGGLLQSDLADLEELLQLAGQNGQSQADQTDPGQIQLPTEDAEAGKQKADTERKQGFFSKIWDFLTEEEEEEAEAEIKLSDENKKILKELNKKKKSKKAAEGEDASSDKKKKPKREKKPKQAKTEMNDNSLTEGQGEQTGRRLPVKQVLPIILCCLSVGLVVILCANISGEYADKRAGRKAFYEEDYQTCYQNLFGKNLNESEQVMFGKSESILSIRLWMREYEILAENGQEAEALDSLLQSVSDYPTLYTYSEQWNADEEVAEIYGQMLQILFDRYRLTEEQALEIAAIPDDVEYSRIVYGLAGAGNPPEDSSTQETVKE